MAEIQIKDGNTDVYPKIKSAVNEDNQIATGIVQRVRGNSISIEIGSSISLPSAAQTTIATLTKYKPNNIVYAMGSPGGTSNKLILISILTDGKIVAYNYSGSAQIYLFATVNYLV